MESKEVMAVAIEEKVLLLRVSSSRGGSRDGSRDLIGTLAKIGLDVLQAREDGTDGSGMTLVLRASDPVLMLERARGALGDGRDAKIASGYGLVSVVGSGLLNDPALWARIARALGNADIHPETVFYSPLSIGLVIGKDRVEEAVRLLHAEFLEAKA